MKPKYSTFVTFPEEVFTFPSVFEELGLCNLIGFHLYFYLELVKVFYSNIVKKKGKLTSIVKGVPISLIASDICVIFEIPPGGHKFVGTIAPWENYNKHAFYYSLSRLSEHQFYNKRKKSFGGDNPERVYWSPCTITDPEMVLLYSIKTHFHVDWANSGDEFNPPTEVQPDQPSNQMIMDYLEGFRTDVMTEIGHLSLRMDQWELSQAGFQGSSYQCGGFQGGGYPDGRSNDGNNNQ
ncbi:hypothetical protein KIW84_044119 [Lathyrus oleraceus]|uniref:Uncharacterized protein n=1 Tax=Pisum sativum TaxID=3888 RepID=A0A9D4XFF5_PEA|nr:hypothetical protein KIW84_044119 [Pisum sativum]